MWDILHHIIRATNLSGKGCNHSTVGTFCVAFKVSGLLFFSLTGELNQNQDTYSYESPVEPHNLTFTIKKKSPALFRHANSNQPWNIHQWHQCPQKSLLSEVQDRHTVQQQASQLAPVFGPCNLARLASSSISSIIRSWETEKNV